MDSFFNSYTEIEKKIFNVVKQFFESLPASVDDYKNGFYDIVAQYGGGGQHYIMIEEFYHELMCSQIQDLVENLPIDEKKDLTTFYEENYLENYMDREGENYIYTGEELAEEISGRFKGWIDDNFSLDDMLEDDEEDEEDEEDDEGEEENVFN